MSCDDKDLIMPIGPLPDGRVLVSRHRPDHSEQMATIQPARDGVPMVEGQEYITASKVPRADGSYEVTGSYTHKGPAQVATPNYRDGWDRTFNSPGGSA